MTLVKLGGSLLDWPEFPSRLAAFLESRRGEPLILIVGGGRAADWVRDLDRIHGLGQERSHGLAVRTLDLTARIVAEVVPGLRVVEAFAEVEAAWKAGRVPVLAPRLFLDQDDREATDPLPHSWDATSDSIAARLAVRLGAEELILLKSAAIPPGIDRGEASRLGLVDPVFPEASAPLDRVALACLRDPVGRMKYAVV